MKLILAKFYKDFTRLRHWTNNNSVTTLCGKKPIESKEVELTDSLGQTKPVCANCSWIKKSHEESKM